MIETDWMPDDRVPQGHTFERKMLVRRTRFPKFVSPDRRAEVAQVLVEVFNEDVTPSPRAERVAVRRTWEARFGGVHVGEFASAADAKFALDARFEEEAHAGAA